MAKAKKNKKRGGRRGRGGLLGGGKMQKGIIGVALAYLGLSAMIPFDRTLLAAASYAIAPAYLPYTLGMAVGDRLKGGIGTGTGRGRGTAVGGYY